VALVALAAPHGGCWSQVGTLVTDVQPGPGDSLTVTACLLEHEKAGRLRVESCSTSVVPRSNAGIDHDREFPPREGEFVTGVFAREGGGVTVISCVMVADRETGGPAFADCRESVLSLEPGGVP
jgi:hypothetical protein